MTTHLDIPSRREAGIKALVGLLGIGMICNNNPLMITACSLISVLTFLNRLSPQVNELEENSSQRPKPSF